MSPVSVSPTWCCRLWLSPKCTTACMPGSARIVDPVNNRRCSASEIANIIGLHTCAAESRAAPPACGPLAHHCSVRAKDVGYAHYEMPSAGPRRVAAGHGSPPCWMVTRHDGSCACLLADQGARPPVRAGNRLQLVAARRSAMLVIAQSERTPPTHAPTWAAEFIVCRSVCHNGTYAAQSRLQHGEWTIPGFPRWDYHNRRP